MCDAAVDLVDVDASPGYLVIYDGMTALVTVTFGATAFGDAVGGVATAIGLPLSGTAVASGTADSFAVFDGAGTKRWAGTVGGTLQATTGDLQLGSTVIAVSDSINITSLSFTVPLAA